jgi:hypothetical protein
MRRATIALAIGVTLGACGTEEWGFYDLPPDSGEASLDAGDAFDADAVKEAPADGDAAEAACNPDASRCPVSCAGGVPCPEDVPVCTEPHYVCQGCRSNQDCDSVRYGPICTTSGACIPECDPNHPCPPSRPHCDRLIGRCVSSSSSSPVPAPAPSP